MPLTALTNTFVSRYGDPKGPLPKWKHKTPTFLAHSLAHSGEDNQVAIQHTNRKTNKCQHHNPEIGQEANFMIWVSQKQRAILFCR